MYMYNVCSNVSCYSLNNQQPVLFLYFNFDVLNDFNFLTE